MCLILIVDDHDDVRGALGAALRDAGHEVELATAGLFKQGDLKPVLKAQAFWSKPVDPDQLENVHEHCPAHRQSWPPASAPL